MTFVALTLNSGLPPPGCYKTSIRYDLNVNIRKTSPVQFNDKIYLIDDIKCKYKNLNHYFEVPSSDEKRLA